MRIIYMGTPDFAVPALDALVKVNDAPGAETQLLTFAPQLSAEARAEARRALPDDLQSELHVLAELGERRPRGWQRRRRRR